MTEVTIVQLLVMGDHFLFYDGRLGGIVRKHWISGYRFDTSDFWGGFSYIARRSIRETAEKLIISLEITERLTS